MIPLIALGLVLSFLDVSRGYASTDEAAYATMTEFTSITSKTINSAGCLITASANFPSFIGHQEVFRNAWLNKDYSIDFYNQRRKQVFVFMIVKRYAELLTEGLYREANPPSCSFSISARYEDKFGKPQELIVAMWKFDQSTNKKVDWDKIDPRNFAKIAIDYKVTPEAMSWLSDEPSMAGGSNKKDQRGEGNCQLDMLKANAIFIRAVTYCAKNYMDSPAGYYALAVSKQCAQSLDEDKLEAIATDAMRQLDTVVKQKGRTQACHWVERIEKEVRRSVTN